MSPTRVPPHAAKSSWRQRAGAQIRAQLTQGTSPDRIAFTLAIGTACSLVPFLGFTSLLNLAVGICLRLNQPILQAWNQLLGPLQLALILVYVRLGEKLWQAAPVPFSIPVLTRAFRENPRLFLERFGWTGVHAATAWALSAPVVIVALYSALRPVLRKFAAGQKS